MSLIQDAKDHVIHEIIPGLNPSVSGHFQVRVIGALKGHVELELRIVDPNDREKVVHSFGSAPVLIGRTATLEGLISTINFLPRELT